MTPVMRRLIWLALLIGGCSVILDWQDDLDKLRPEHERLERLRAREQSAISAIDWQHASREAAQAQLEWLNRLPEVSQLGVFRAEAMETMADLCKRLDAPCQVSAMGETSAQRPSPADGMLSSGTASRAAGRSTGTGTPSGPAELQGLLTTSVRIATPPGKHLVALLQGIEDGPVLRKIDRFTVRGGRAEIVVKTYGLDQQAATTYKSAALRQAEGMVDLPGASAGKASQ
ncbi:MULTISPECIES: hypothetical protein [Diaphorobacter]|uniref:hypothetical protein n=1 Tax=Diaphorobacter TaxID=238749 RepID=UPI0011E4CDD2|nr:MULTISPECIES: hypothetical protein [Diaphorobacter]